MTDAPFLRVVGTAEPLDLAEPTSEESLTYQAKLLGLWCKSQHPEAHGHFGGLLLACLAVYASRVI